MNAGLLIRLLGVLLAGGFAVSLAGCGCGQEAEPGQNQLPVKAASAQNSDEAGAGSDEAPEGEDGPQEDGDQRPEAPLPADIPVFSLSAEEFFRGYQRDREAAVRKYTGAVVELRGVVGIMEHDVGGAPAISLKAMDDPVGVKCITLDAQPWAKVSPGQKVEVRGRLPDFHVGPALEQCRLKSLEPDPALALDAEQLAAEAAADAVAAMAKYQGKYLRIRGSVSEKQEAPNGTTRVTLAARDGVRVVCQFPPFEKPRVDAMAIGQPLRAIGRCTGARQPRLVLLDLCVPIE
jgi:hypothetical protein